MTKVRRLLAMSIVLPAALAGHDGASAHSGGTDSSGGHYCRQAGYDSGSCSPLGSYHCHRSPCGDPAPATTAPATTATTAKATTTTTVRRTTTTTSPPPTIATKAAPTTTAVPTTTTAAPTTTAVPSTTTIAPTTTEVPTPTTEPVDLSGADPTSTDRSEEEADPVAAAFGFAILGGLGFGGYKLAKRHLRKRPDTSDDGAIDGADPVTADVPEH